jgi:hypothetical protein
MHLLAEIPYNLAVFKQFSVIPYHKIVSKS